MYKRSLTLAVVLATFTALSCGSGGGGNFNLISVEEEWQLGQQLAQQVAQQSHFNTDPAVNAYVQQMGQRLVARTPAPYNQLPWDFHVIDDPAINAFSIPGGHVYVNTGLIANAENASELAGVIAHEISHVTARHSTEMISRQYGLEVLGGLVLGQNPGALQQIVAQIVAGGTLARYSRADEKEADDLGLQLMADAGYNPMGMPAMFRILLAKQQSQPGRVEQFFASHPATESRIQDTEKRAASLSRGNFITDEPQFQSIRRRVS